jgi:hypothetical protein
MGTFAETANIVYRLWFADQGKNNFHFPLVAVFVYTYTLPFQTENGSPGVFP